MKGWITPNKKLQNCYYSKGPSFSQLGPLIEKKNFERAPGPPRDCMMHLSWAPTEEWNPSHLQQLLLVSTLLLVYDHLLGLKWALYPKKEKHSYVNI